MALRQTLGSRAGSHRTLGELLRSVAPPVKDANKSSDAKKTDDFLPSFVIGTNDKLLASTLQPSTLHASRRVASSRDTNAVEVVAVSVC